MNKDKFTIIGGDGDDASFENGDDTHVAIGLELVKKFADLSHADKLKVIEFVDRLKGSGESNES